MRKRASSLQNELEKDRRSTGPPHSAPIFQSLDMFGSTEIKNRHLPNSRKKKVFNERTSLDYFADSYIPFEVDDAGKVVPRNYICSRRSGEDSGHGTKAKLKRRILPFVRRFSENVSAAISEMDLTKIVDFSVEDTVEGKAYRPMDEVCSCNVAC